MKLRFQYNDGGRSRAGFKGRAGDCVARSIAITSGVPYKEIYDILAQGNASQRKTRGQKRARSARNGIITTRKWFKDLMTELGYKWIPCMEIGIGCKVHMREGELPKGKLVLSLSKHYTAVIDGIIHDTYDCSRSGNRCVYGYWKKL